MAPFVFSVLSTLLASANLLAHPINAAASFIPALKEHSTLYASTKSSAGFMFDVKSKASIVIYGLDINMIPSNFIKDGPEARVLVYTKEDGFVGFEKDEDAWDLWINTTIIGSGMDKPTAVPQSAQEDFEPLLLPSKSKRSFYVAFEGPYLRYSDTDKWYYINHDLMMYGNGASKRKGWAGSFLSPRTFNGGLHYYLGEQVLELPGKLLPGSFITEGPTVSPTKEPTVSPTASLVPTLTSMPTSKPTLSPTKTPTKRPTSQPTASPIAVEMFSTKFEGREVKPVLVYAGCMFDLKGRDNIEIKTIGIHTYLKSELEVQLYIREGGYKGAEDDLSEWTWVNNVTVQGEGLGEPTYLPIKSFEPILLRKFKTLGFYITTDGPYIRASRGDVEGKPFAANQKVVVYQGLGKRYPINAGSLSPRLWNGVIGYDVIDIPSPSPTIDTSGMFVKNATFIPVEDAYIQKGKTSAYGSKAQLMVDGSPERVTLMKFDISVLNGNTASEPDQILSAVLRLYSMTEADFGGYISVIPEGEFDEDEDTWDTSPYATEELGTTVNQFRSIWKNKFYEIDITPAFRETIPQTLVIRIWSDSNNGVMYRSSDGASPNGPRLTVNFAYEPSLNQALAQMFGSDPPTIAPTAKPTTPEWANPKTPENPWKTYFNYNPRSNWGPERWNRVRPNGYHDQFKRLKTDPWRNKCGDGRRQSPRNLCQTSDKCMEFHETRPRRGEYGLGARNETVARPTPSIHHNKLRLSYKERRSDGEPAPPGCDFARNGLNSGVQDLIHIDLKVKSEHRLCGKQYDGEMQLYYLHQYGNLEAMGILINGDGTEENGHFQILLDYFQEKFDADKQLCERKQQRARALFKSRTYGRDSKEEEDGMVSQQQTKRLRGGTSIETSEGADGMAMDEFESQGDDFKAADAESSSSLSSMLFHKIHNRFLSLINRQRDTKELRWDPLEPMDIYRSIHFWAYSGSTTEPPCMEDVKWRIVDVPFTITPNQLIQLKKLMFDHVDPTSCRKTSTHYDESNARPVQPYRGGATYRCRRSNYASDMERAAAGGRRKGFVLRENWKGVDMHPYFDPEFPDV